MPGTNASYKVMPAYPKERQHALSEVGKSRLLGFSEGSSFPWSYGQFAQRYGRDVIEQGSVPIVFATPAQIADVKRVLEIVKLP